MAKLTIHKTANGENWVNTYELQGEYNSQQAIDDAATIVAFERSIYLSNIIITHYNISDGVEDTDAYISTPVNLVGLVVPSSDAAPLYNTLRIDFSKLGGGRPGRKYYRGVLREDVMGAFGALLPNSIAAWQTLAQAMADNTSAGGEGFTYVTAAVYPFAQMRQLRRGSKKKNVPSSPIPV